MNPLMQIIDLGAPPANKIAGQSNDSVTAGIDEKPAGVFEELLGKKLTVGLPVQLDPALYAAPGDRVMLNQNVPTEYAADIDGQLDFQNDNIGLKNQPIAEAAKNRTLNSGQLERIALSKNNVSPLIGDGAGQNILKDFNITSSDHKLFNQTVINQARVSNITTPDPLTESIQYILNNNSSKALHTNAGILRTELPAVYHQVDDGSIIRADEFKELNIKDVNITRFNDASGADKGSNNIRPTMANNGFLILNSDENNLIRDDSQFGDNQRTANYDVNRRPSSNLSEGKGNVNGFENILKSKPSLNNGLDNTNNNTGNLSQLTLESSSPTTNNPLHSQASMVKEDASQVRFIFPAEPENTAVRNGHTVTIKMEPEHLGTVRMTVTSIHDTITARLVVESGTAKTALESNLNNLVEHLDRQGIKVDAFQVSVSGGQVGERFAQREFPKTWRREPKSSRIMDKFKAIPEAVENLSRQRQYISATGVNCLA
jgi:hypothetical protein